MKILHKTLSTGRGSAPLLPRLQPRILFLFLGTVILFVACATSAPAPQAPDYWPTDGWRSSTPEEQGMNTERLSAMVAEIEQEGHAIDSVVVVRNGYLVLDAYFAPFEAGDKHIIYSCTKSVVSALVGIAIDRGEIEGADQRLLDLFPGRKAANLDARKEAMTLEDVLMMATGLDCRDSYLYRWRGLHEMEESDDWVQHMLDLPMVAEPGTRFEYCNGASFLLSALIHEKTGLSALDYARQHLFGPLGITDVTWTANPQGINIGWSDLRMTPRDMAKIGLLYLSGGQWDGQQIVPSAWVEASTRKRISATLEDGYGYQWWVIDDGIYLALGYAGQFIYVVPEENLVAVFVSDLPEDEFYTPQQLLYEYIIPAATSSNIHSTPITNIVISSNCSATS